MLKLSLVKMVLPIALLTSLRTPPRWAEEEPADQTEDSIPDLMEKVYNYGTLLSGIIQNAEQRLREIERAWGEVDPYQAVAASRFVEDAYRIIQTMQDRLYELRRISRDPHSPAFHQTKQLINSNLTVPMFGTASLGWKSNQWALSPEGWFPILDAFLRRAEFKIHNARDLEAFEVAAPAIKPVETPDPVRSIH